MIMKLIFFILSVLALSLFQVKATNWNQYRGPNGSGVAQDCQPPYKISKKNLIWKTLLIPGFSSPALSEDKLFLTG